MRIKLPKFFTSKKIIFLALILLFLFCFTKKALAYIPEIGGNTDEITSPYTQQFTEGLKSDSWEKSSFDFTTINNVMESLTTSIIGTGDEEVNQKLGPTALGTATNLIAYMYQKAPASSIEYFADLGKKLQITQPVYAQGVGFEGLRPVLEIWRTFRNISYLFFTIIIVFIGFAVMFRLKINPQTVITIQSALPKITIALILVTFSYAIAGLLIDFIYIVISLFANLLDLPIIYNRNLFGLVQDMFGGFRAPAETLGLTIREFINDITIDFAGWIGGSLAKLIFSVALLFSVFKLFFILVIAYISIIAGVIFSPIMLILEAIPGQKGLMNWLKMMVTNIIPFIIVGVLFLLGSKLISTSTGESIWVGPFLGSSTTEAYIPSLIGFAIVLAAPSVITSVQKAIGTPGIAGMAAGVIAPITGAWESIRGVAVGAYKVGRQGYEMTPYAQRRAGARKVLSEAKGRKQLVESGLIDDKTGKLL